MPHLLTLDRRTFLKASAVVAAAGAQKLQAQEIFKLLVGFPPGGAIDLTARVYADAAKELGNIIVDNRPGAAGNIAAAALAQSRPESRTLMFAPVNVYCIAQSLYPKLGFDTARDFLPVGLVARFPWAIAVHPSVPAHSLPQLVDWLKANPEKAMCGMAAIGSEGHLMAYAFSRSAGVDLHFAAYKGGAPMVQDLMAGHIPFAFDPIVNLSGPHKAGKVRMLALTSAERSVLLPDVPTFGEQGFKAVTGDTWIGASVRVGTPAQQVQALAAAFSNAAGKPEVQSRLAGSGLTTVAAAPVTMAKAMEVDTARYAGLIKAMGLRIE